MQEKFSNREYGKKLCSIKEGLHQNNRAAGWKLNGLKLDKFSIPTTFSPMQDCPDSATR
jgi:hypothetical protein